MIKHPILELCLATPVEYEDLTGELLDKFYEIFSKHKIYVAKNRDEVFKILVEAMPSLELIDYSLNNEVFKIKQSELSKRIILEYGK